MTTGATFPVAGFQVTVLSVLVEALLPLPAASVALLAPIVTITVPVVVIPPIATSNVLWSPRIGDARGFVPPAVPVIVTSPFPKSRTASLKTAVKWIGAVLVGSAWPTAWLIVTRRGGLVDRVDLAGEAAVAAPPVPPSLFPPASAIESLSFRFSPSVPLPVPVFAVTV